MSTQTKEKRGPWLAMASCAVPAVVAVALSVFSDSSWKIPLLILIPLCFIVAEVAIFRLHERIRALRQQVVALQEIAGIGTDPVKEGSAKGAYSVDEDSKLRLHISRLQ
jgi:hypothetical protein